jgi:hypothetical protein
MKRFVIVVSVVVLGAAAPARAWCEAACVRGPAGGSAFPSSPHPHCSLVEDAGGVTISAAGVLQCPEAHDTRPTVSAREPARETSFAAVAVAPLAAGTRYLAPPHAGIPAPLHPCRGGSAPPTPVASPLPLRI